MIKYINKINNIISYTRVFAHFIQIAYTWLENDVEELLGL